MMITKTLLSGSTVVKYAAWIRDGMPPHPDADAWIKEGFLAYTILTMET